MEDYEYLWTLNHLLTNVEAAGKSGPAIDTARQLLTIHELVKETGAYETDAAKYVAYRAQLAEAIVGLQQIVEK